MIPGIYKISQISNQLTLRSDLKKTTAFVSYNQRKIENRQI